MKKRLTIILVLTGALAFGAALGTWAYFTSTAVSEENVFTTGTLSIENPGSLTRGLAVDNIFPGWESRERLITVANTGSLKFKYRVSVASLKGNVLYDGPTPLQVKIGKDDYKDIDKLGYTELGTIEAGSKGTFTIRFRLPAQAGNEYQGKTAKFDFIFDATQENNPNWSESGE